MKTKQLTFLLAFIPALLSAQWSAVRFDQVNTFTKVFTVTVNTVFVSGYANTGACFLVRTNNGGITWDSIWINTATSGYQIEEIYFPDVNNGFCGGNNGANQALLKTNDNGTTWTDITPDPASLEAITAIYFLNAQNGFAATSTKLYTTTNGGSNWTTQSISFYITDLSFTDMQHGTASGQDLAQTNALMMQTADGGQTWTPALSMHDVTLFYNEFKRVDVINNSTQYTALSNNKLFRTLDGGLTWDTIVCDSVYAIADFDFSSVDSGHVLSNMGQIYRTNDGGLTWALEYTVEWGFYGPSIYLYSISFVDMTGYVTGTSGLIKKHEATSGITETPQGGAITLYPNPASGFTTISLQTAAMQGECLLQITNSTGQLVLEKKLLLSENALVTLPGMKLPAGVYFVSLTGRENRSVQRLVIQE